MTSPIDSLAQQYLSLKHQIKYLEHQVSAIKLDIDKYLDEHNKSKVVTETYVFERRPMQMELIRKSDVPESIWKQYAKPQHHSALFIRPLPKSTPRKRSGRSRKN